MQFQTVTVTCSLCNQLVDIPVTVTPTEIHPDTAIVTVGISDNNVLAKHFASHHQTEFELANG